MQKFLAKGNKVLLGIIFSLIMTFTASPLLAHASTASNATGTYDGTTGTIIINNPNDKINFVYKVPDIWNQMSEQQQNDYCNTNKDVMMVDVYADGGSTNTSNIQINHIVTEKQVYDAKVSYDKDKYEATVAFTNGEKVTVGIYTLKEVKFETLDKNKQTTIITNRINYLVQKNNPSANDQVQYNQFANQVQGMMQQNINQFQRMQKIVEIMMPIALLVDLVIAVIGYKVAVKKNRSGWLWGFLSALNIIFLIIILVIGEHISINNIKD